MKNLFYKIFVSLVAMFAVALGGGGNVLMAAGAATSDENGSGAAEGASAPENKATDPGAASVTTGQQAAPDLYETDLEQAILVLDPMGTAGLNLIETGVQSRQVHSQEFEFYSVGPRLVRTTTTGLVTNLADRVLVPVSDSGFASKNDTIRVVGVSGQDKSGNTDTKDLMLIVIDRDVTTGNLVCYAKNGYHGGFNLGGSTGANVTVNYIPTGSTLIRMSKSCSEAAAQTSRATAYPASEKGYCQNFMLQIEQTEFDKLTEKRVAWNFNDIVDWNMRNYKIEKELTYLFSVGGLDRHVSNDREDNYTMTGIWYQAGRNLEIGHIVLDDNGAVVYDTDASGEEALPFIVTTSGGTTTYTMGDHTFAENPGLVANAYYYYNGGNPIPAVAKVEINGSDLVKFNKLAFVGNGGSQVKHLLAGCNVVEAFDNIKGKQFENKDIVTEDNLIVQNFKTSFGTIKLIYDKLFDVCGMANAALMIDKQYLRKVWFKSLSQTKMDFRASGQRNSTGVILQEVNAVYLQYADAHAQVWLAGRTDVYDYIVAGKYDAVATTDATSSVRGTGSFPGGHKQADFS